MTKISAASMYVHKIVFPLFWFGFLAFFMAMSFIADEEFDPLFTLAPIAMGVFGYFLFKKLVWDLADEVFDYGDYLLIRRRGEEVKVRLADIVNVNASTNMRPERITLRLASPSRFGDEIAFTPKSEFSLNVFARNRIAEDLIMRADRARSSR